MPLSQSIIDRIRDEIGMDEDVSDADLSPDPAPLGDLETIYTDENRGNYSVLNTAYIVWRRRLASYQESAFNATIGGSLMQRSDRVRFLKGMVQKYSLLVDYTLKGSNQAINSDYQKYADSGSEFS